MAVLVLVESPTPNNAYLTPEAYSLALVRSAYTGQAKAK